MASATIIWSRKDRKVVPTPDAIFTGSNQSNDADAAIRRIVGKAGDTKDKQGQVFDKITVTI
jgi:hypothetical protein